MNEELQTLKAQLLAEIAKKNSWGKNELKEMILETFLDFLIKRSPGK